GMAIHPPMLYLGFTGFIIPFAFAVAALASGDLSAAWIKATRRWTLIAWLFLSLGLILGGRWAYDVLGWGGYWGWDPVENAAFLPWLMGTAYLHSVMIQEKRGMLKTWNMALVILTFSAVIFGTFATRSGLIESVHSFARSEVGFPMFAFWFILTFIAVGLTLYRRSQGALRDDREFVNLFSRETLFVLNNLIFVALFAAIFWGSFGAPIISELFLDTNITLGTQYYYEVTTPLFAALYLLMGIAPLSAWGVTSLKRLSTAMVVPMILTGLSLVLLFFNGMTLPLALLGYGIVILAGWVAAYETYRGVRARTRTQGENPLQALLKIYSRNPRRYGGYMIHIGVTVIGIGVLGSTVYQMETQKNVQIGESINIGGYELTYDEFRGGQVAEDGRILEIADLTLTRGGNFVSNLSPRRDFFPEANDMNTMTIAAAHSTLENDFYVLLVGWEDFTYETATFKVYINPLVNLVWWGSLILILGTIIAIYPRQIIPAQVRERFALPASGQEVRA
ncbi:MAG: heme lyase CcmF/NrfE family subunit, partial [Aggregatilineales bacterium]